MANNDSIKLDILYNFYFESHVRIMCKKLDEIKGKSPQELLKILGDSLSVPIDIEGLLNHLSIKCEPFDFTNFENSLNRKDIVLGAALVDEDDIVVLYRNDVSENRKRFTLAHELAHCCLDADNLRNGHIEFRNSQDNNTENEFRANVFAGQLLIPQELLMHEYNNMIAPLSDVLAKKFGVSTNVMEKRLDYLLLPYYSPVIPKEAVS